jgi:hypothetical protein
MARLKLAAEAAAEKRSLPSTQQFSLLNVFIFVSFHEVFFYALSNGFEVSYEERDRELIVRFHKP